MSKDWSQDIHDMHTHYGMREWVKEQIELGRIDKLFRLLEFRLNFLDEELLEARKAVQSDNYQEVVDAMIDLCVVAIGTLDLFEVDSHSAWDEVHRANMSKKRGVKPGRPNPLGLPDLMKPDGWKAPEHGDNIGHMKELQAKK